MAGLQDCIKNLVSQLPDKELIAKELAGSTTPLRVLGETKTKKSVLTRVRRSSDGNVTLEIEWID